jgi:hypothetical protein
MAQTTVKFPGGAKRAPADLAHKQLEVEKAGVIVGFLAGLPVAVGPVSELLHSIGASDFASGIGMVLTVAVTTRVGLLVGAKLATLIGAGR